MLLAAAAAHCLKLHSEFCLQKLKISGFWQSSQQSKIVLLLEKNWLKPQPLAIFKNVFYYTAEVSWAYMLFYTLLAVQSAC